MEKSELRPYSAEGESSEARRRHLEELGRFCELITKQCPQAIDGKLQYIFAGSAGSQFMAAAETAMHYSLAKGELSDRADALDSEALRRTMREMIRKIGDIDLMAIPGAAEDILSRLDRAEKQFEETSSIFTEGHPKKTDSGWGLETGDVLRITDAENREVWTVGPITALTRKFRQVMMMVSGGDPDIAGINGTLELDQRKLGGDLQALVAANTELFGDRFIDSLYWLGVKEGVFATMVCDPDDPALPLQAKELYDKIVERSYYRELLSDIACPPGRELCWVAILNAVSDDEASERVMESFDMYADLYESATKVLPTYTNVRMVYGWLREQPKEYQVAFANKVFFGDDKARHLENFESFAEACDDNMRVVEVVEEANPDLARQLRKTPFCTSMEMDLLSLAKRGELTTDKVFPLEFLNLYLSIQAHSIEGQFLLGDSECAALVRQDLRALSNMPRTDARRFLREWQELSAEDETPELLERLREQLNSIKAS